MAEKALKKKSPDRKGKILLISYFFPPTAGGGVFRPLAMAKYLYRMGWDITVITATTPKHYPVDSGLEKQVPSGVRVIRIPVVWEGSAFRRFLGRLKLDWISRNLVTPDERVFWAEKASTLAGKLMREEKFDIFFTTGPPFSILLAGLWLKRDKKCVYPPWVAEFRDPWTIAPYLSIPTPNHRRIAQDTESELMSLAERVIMVTPTFARLMREKYPQQAAKVRCIPNGFDADDFSDMPVRDDWRNDSCTIVAAGTVFGRNNMDDFISSIEKIKASDLDLFNKLKVNFQGLPDTKLNRRLLENGLTSRCSSRGFVTHQENIRDLVTADLLILPLAPVKNSEGHIPSRAYEFLASGTPLLAICPDGDLAQLLSIFPQVIRIEPGDVDGITEEISNAVNRWEKGIVTPCGDANLLRDLTRQAMAVEIDKALSEAINSGGVK